jgi:hypothetical protein
MLLQLTGNMGKKTKQGKPGLGASPAPEGLPQCPYCGGTPAEILTSAAIDELYRSHAELCAAIRLVGRQTVRLRKQEEDSLNLIRGILERAENIRKSVLLRGQSGKKRAANKQHALRVLRFPQAGR